METELIPKYSSQKSFYRKARVKDNILISYDSIVARINENNEVELIDGLWDYSPTILRHLKEWLQQKGFAITRKQDLKIMYKIINK